jgi:hypothetical protein
MAKVHLKVKRLKRKKVHVSLLHGVLGKVVTQIYTPEVTAALPGTAARVSKLAEINTEMDLRDNAHKDFFETPEIQQKDESVNTGVQSLLGTADYLATNKIVPAAEKTAAKRILMELKQLRRVAYHSQERGADKVKDVMNHLLAAPFHADLVTINQLDLVNQIKTDNDERILLRINRKQVSDARVDDDSMYELWDKAEPTLDELFQVTEYFALDGTASQKTAARTALAAIASAEKTALTEMRRHNTYLAKKKGNAKPENPSHKPDESGTDEEHPEAVEPNVPEEGDNSGNGDSGNTEGDNTGGSGGNNNGGSDKPPNPESPDKKKSDSKELDIDISIKEKEEQPEADDSADKGKKKKKK